MKKTPKNEALWKRAHAAGLYGILSRWDEFADQPWLVPLLDCEEEERRKRSLERRQYNARIGRFKPLADYDWDWPKTADKDAITDLFDLDFVGEPANVVIVGPNGVGKTMLAQNLTYHAVMKGFTARFVTASEMLNDLAAQDSNASLERRLKRYLRPRVLAIDELGYLSYDDRHADLLFEVVSRRNGERPIVLTTNKPFKEWNQVFPNASCVVALVDRLIHRAEVIRIDGESYRLKEAKERSERKAKERKKVPRHRTSA